MILAYNDTDLVIDESDFSPHVVVVENPSFFREIIMELSNQISGLDGKFVFSNGTKKLDIAKMVELVVNPLVVNANSRKIVNKLYDVVDKVANNETMYAETMHLKSELDAYMQKLVYETDYPLDFSSDYSVKALFSAVDLRFDNMDNSALERLTTYFEIIRKLTDIKVVVIVNLSNYFELNEMAMLYREAKNRKIQLVLFEARYENKISDEKLLIIDKDLCIVRTG